MPWESPDEQEYRDSKPSPTALHEFRFDYLVARDPQVQHGKKRYQHEQARVDRKQMNVS